MNVEPPIPRLKVVALGPLTVIYDEVNITGQLSRTTQLLLIYLLTTAKPQAREVLAELFWPERSAQQAASNLRTVLTELRKACAEAVVITRTHVAVAPSCIDYDVAAFRLHLTAAGETLSAETLKTAAAHWEAALHLYQRPFFAGLREPPSAELQLWLTLERELLYHQMLSTLRQLVGYYTNRDERAAALAWAKRWLALEPVDEDALQQVMRLSAQQGEPEAALTYYRAYLRVQQQGSTTVEVTPALTTLVNEILQGVYVPVLPLLLPTTNRDAGAKPDPSGALVEPPEQPTNLPGTLAPLIGRSQEIDQVCTLLLTEKQRLVTIVGLGGQGKTRLAVAVAAACRAAYPDGVWFVALEGITGPYTEQTQADSPARLHEQVANAIGAALGQSLFGTQPATEQVMRQLQDKTLCLVLDNFEPLIPVAPFLLQLLEGAPQITLLVTSRVRLNLLAERVYLLGGLTLPASTTAAAVAQSTAGQLFLASARRHLTAFAIDETNAPAIARLCQLTAGMPLALILASTWVEHLNPAEIVAELEANLALLSTDTLHLPLRQQNVAQIIEVSWQALAPLEQLALAQLSVFVEPFTRQAAQAVANVTLAQLRTLTDKALLTVDGPGAYHFHPLIHQFARQKLADLDDTASPYPAQARQRHASYIQQLVQRLTTPAATLQDPTGKHRWPGYGDVQAAITWCLAHQPATAFAFLVELYPLWERYGYIGDARHWLQMGLACAPPATLARAHLLRLGGYFAEKQQELPVARQQLVEALQLYKQLQHADGEAATLSILGWVTFRERPQYTDVQPALAYFERSLQLYRSLYNRHKMADQLRDISQLLIIENQRSSAEIQQYLQEALTIYQALEERAGQASIWKLLGHLELAQDNYTMAAIYLDQAICCAEATAMDHERAWIYHIRSSMAYSQRDTVALHQYGTKAYTIFKAIQDPHGIMLAVFWIGLAEYQLGNHQAALPYLREGLALAHKQHLLYWIARYLAVMTAAGLALQITSAAALGGAAEVIFAQQEEHFTKWEQQDLAALLATARSYRQHPGTIRQWEQGKALPLAIVIEWALQGLFQAWSAPSSLAA